MHELAKMGGDTSVPHPWLRMIITMDYCWYAVVHIIPT